MSAWISVIIPARNAGATLEACLGSIHEASAKTGPVELLVADNGSTDATAAIAKRLGATLLSVPGLRVSAVRNRAARTAQAPLLAFVDADHRVGPAWFEGVRTAFADASIVAAGAEYLAPDDATWVQRTYDRLRLHRPGRHDVTWLPSGNLAIRADVFQRIGGFDESLETCEDVDLCRRLVTRGRLVADEALASVHYGDPRTLRAVYAGEVWRGRDNLRVTLRPPMNLRSVLSAVQPLATVAVLTAAVLLMLIDWRHSLQYLIGAATFVVLATVPRAMQMALRGSGPSRLVLLQCLVVAIAFDLGRAAAIVVHATHATRATVAEARSS
jgi:glycosyltransferase involved in cell wall biosynthesis